MLNLFHLNVILMRSVFALVGLLTLDLLTVIFLWMLLICVCRTHLLLQISKKDTLSVSFTGL